MAKAACCIHIPVRIKNGRITIGINAERIDPLESPIGLLHWLAWCNRCDLKGLLDGTLPMANGAIEIPVED